MRVQDEIIVLHHTLYGEKSVILHCLSKEWGRRSFIVKNASKLMGYFQPLSILECEISENPKSSLYSATAFCAISPLGGIRSSHGKTSISMFVSEVLFRALREGTVEESLFDWCKREIMLLNDLEQGYANFHLRFLLDFGAALGFSPGKEDLLPFLENLTARTLPLMDRNCAVALSAPLDGNSRREICARLLKYLEFHLESPLNIRSLAILADIS